MVQDGDAISALPEANLEPKPESRFGNDGSAPLDNFDRLVDSRKWEEAVTGLQTAAQKAIAARQGLAVKALLQVCSKWRTAACGAPKSKVAFKESGRIQTLQKMV